jgi:type IV pilus assembly protein PilA
MRKLMSKKGFTLVELMIVVVILGILVAVAVPIFSAVTKNARTKTCASNVRIIKSNMSTYYMSGNGGDPFTTEQANILTDTRFTGLFDGA